MINSKKILIVSYFFPPFAEVGAVRTAKIVKYLKKLDWEITVICALEKYYQSINNSYMEDIKGARVIRTRRMRKFIPGLNEEGFYWIPFILAKMIKEIKANKPDIIYYSGGPFFHWIIAPLIMKIFGVKYVLDMRDPFSLNPYTKHKSFFTSISLFYSKYAEAFAIKYANSVINVTDFAAEMYKNHYSKYREKMITFSNGYDPDDFINLDSKNLEGFSIVYSGKFGVFRDPTAFFQGFKEVIEKNNFSPKEISFIWIGRKENHIVEIIDNLKLNSYVKYTGYIPYKENLEYIKAASLTLLVAGNNAYEPTTKVFDYAALNRRILGIVNVDGFLKTELSNYEEGYICQTKDQVFDVINNCIINNHYYIQKNSMKRFDRSEIVRSLDKYLTNQIKENIYKNNTVY